MFATLPGRLWKLPSTWTSVDLRHPCRPWLLPWQGVQGVRSWPGLAHGAKFRRCMAHVGPSGSGTFAAGCRHMAPAGSTSRPQGPSSACVSTPCPCAMMPSSLRAWLEAAFVPPRYDGAFSDRNLEPPGTEPNSPGRSPSTEALSRPGRHAQTILEFHFSNMRRSFFGCGISNTPFSSPAHHGSPFLFIDASSGVWRGWAGRGRGLTTGLLSRQEVVS